jgi:uncharacterized protein (TIGR02246 family)
MPFEDVIAEEQLRVLRQQSAIKIEQCETKRHSALDTKRARKSKSDGSVCQLRVPGWWLSGLYLFNCGGYICAMKNESFFTRVTRRIAVILTCGAVVSALAAADAGDSRQQLIKIEKELAAALKKNDAKLMASMLAEDWKLVDSDGAVYSRDEIQEMMTSGKLKFESYDSGEFDIRLYGDTAIVIGRDSSKGTYGGEEFSNAGRFTDVFVKKDGAWKLVSSQETTISE